ncbi:hypothetical protein [Photobacterium sanguinicancri]|uniref:Restriction endonuclease n=1 Tax=Photobacterium sanguinicancri TaxID=875932 RepID=A0AAW7Y4E5_9GAMM|nr:hypothetical protein [Photobacterium sanguinicancri]MDO6543488.1 hypothetical protein [Photobacterium sanguinicancri]
MSRLFYNEAFEFYSKHIYRTDFFNILSEHGFSITGSIPSIAWELFGAILTGKQGSSGYGADLEGFEVKSAKEKSSFEYQYHLHTGLSKLREDMTVKHLFCSYESSYNGVKVYVVEGIDLSEYFSKWEPLYEENYAVKDPTKRKQRFRKSIAYGAVIKKGKLVMEIKDGLLIYTASL